MPSGAHTLDDYYIGDFNGDGKVDIAFYELVPYNSNDPTFKIGNFVIIFNENFSKGKHTNTKYYNGCYDDNSNGRHYYKNLLYAFPVDKDGDGVTEICFSRFCYTGGVKPFTNDPLYYTAQDALDGTNTYCNKISKIADGLNVQTSIHYKTGGFTLKQKFPGPSACSYPISSSFFSMPVVNYISESNGIGQTNKTNYYFADPQVHLRGKGFLGFDTIVERQELASHNNLPIYAQTTSIYNSKNPYFYPCLTSAIINYLIVVNDQTLNANYDGEIEYKNLNKYTISENQYTTNFYDYSGNNNHFFPYPTRNNLIQHFYDSYDFTITPNGTTLIKITDKSGSGKTISASTSYSYPEANGTDSYGNITSVQTTNGITTTLTEFENYQVAGSWCPNMPAKKIVTSSRNQEDSKITINYNWDATTGHLISQTSPPGMGNENATVPSTDQTVTTTYEYYPIPGVLKSTTISGSGVTTPSSATLEYDSKFRFVTKQTNALGHVVEAMYNPLYGNIISSKDQNGLVTTYTYDGFGRLTGAVTPTGQEVVNKIDWAGGAETGKNENCLYYIKSFVKTNGINAADDYEFFDMFGRTVGTKTTGYNSTDLYTTTYYNKYGQEVQTRQNGPNTARLVSQISFDEFGQAISSRIYSTTQINDPVTLTLCNTNLLDEETYSYNFQTQNSFKFITKDKNLQATEKIFDPTGMLIQVTDPLGAVVQYSYNSNNQPVSITAQGVVTTISYDKYGRQYQLVDKDAGTSTFLYNSLNQLVEQTDGKGNKYELTYDILGRLKQKKETPAGTTNASNYVYVYDIEAHGKGMISRITGGPNSMSTIYKYDDYSRNYLVTENFDGHTFTTNYGFDDHSRINKITYPSGYIVNHYYDNNTNDLTVITDINNNKIWTLDAVNKLGMVTRSKLGANGQFTKEKTLNDLMMPEEIKFSAKFGPKTWCNKWNYSYTEPSSNGDMSKGNMYSRSNQLSQSGYNNIVARNLSEAFTYDASDRLTQITPNAQQAVPMAISYNLNGNIETKTDASNQVQNYAYGDGSAGQPVHAVKTINPLNEALNPLQTITYTSFNKILQIKENAPGLNETPSTNDYVQLDYLYGLDNERRKMTETKVTNGEAVMTRAKYYSANYELETKTENNITTTRELNYIFAPDGMAAIYEKKNGTGKLYFVSSDALGSVNIITEANNGNIISDMSYDAWGRPRNPQDWSYSNITTNSITDRGYTMHEMLNNFNLINMNGRAYDPLVGQFLSPDPFVGNPENSQSYNRYSYCLNNPLKYVDPSGYISINAYTFAGPPNQQTVQAQSFYEWFINMNLWHAGYNWNSDQEWATMFSRQWEQSVNAIRGHNDWVNKWHILNDLNHTIKKTVKYNGQHHGAFNYKVVDRKWIKGDQVGGKEPQFIKFSNKPNINYRDYYIGDNGAHYRMDLYNNYQNAYNNYLNQFRQNPNTPMNWEARTYLEEKQHIDIPLTPTSYIPLQDFIEVKTINFNNNLDKKGIINYQTRGNTSFDLYVNVNIGDIGLSFGPGSNISSQGIVNDANNANILLIGNIFQNNGGWIPTMNIFVTH